MKSFHNTIRLTGRNLALAEAAAKTQQEKVYIFFLYRRQSAFPPSRVHHLMLMEKLIHDSVPVTSIRRAITNLTKEGKLQQTETMVEGPLGKPEYTWTVKSNRKIKNLPVQGVLL